MRQYVVTGFDERYWNQWGASWLASLKELAKYQGEIVVVSHELSSGTRDKIIEAGGMVLPASKKYDDIRADTFASIAELANGEPGKYAYWDADVYFQDSIEDISTLIDDKIVVSLDHNPGFLAAPHYQWLFIRDVLDSMKMIEGSVSHLISHLIQYYPAFVEQTTDEWNFTNLPLLKDVEGMLRTKTSTPRVIHPAGHIKTFLVNRDILFWERYPDLWSKYTEVPRRSSARKLFVREKHEPVPNVGE